MGSFLHLHFASAFVACAVKVPVGLSDELDSSAPASTEPSQPVAKADKLLLLPLMPSPAALKQKTGNRSSSLSMLLDALDQNLTEQGVVVQPHGRCQLCSQPIIGPVSITVVITVSIFFAH